MTDNQVLYISTIICFVLIMASFKYKKQFARINMVLFLLYNVILYSSLFFGGDYGSSFLWWFYLMIITALQILILSTCIAVELAKRIKHR